MSMRWTSLLVLGVLLAAPRARAGDAPRRVVLVMLGGHVRKADLADEQRMPRLAARTSVLLELEAEASRPHAGAIEMLTGTTGEGAEGGHPRPASPTVMEHARKVLDVGPEAVWFVSHEGGDALHLAHSTDPAFGAAAAPTVCERDGAFAGPLAPLLETLGRPLPTPDATWSLLRDLRRRSDATLGARRPEGVDASSGESERVERALLAEIDRRAALVTGPVPRDAQALRAAATVLAVHRPRLTVVRLGDLALVRDDEARPPVLRALDAALVALHDRVLADPALAPETVLLVVGEPYHPGGEGPGRGGPVGCAALGDGLAHTGRGRTRLVDVAPTVLHLLGAEEGFTGTGRPFLRPRK